MRKSADTAQAKSIESGPQVRSAFLRQGNTHCQWPSDFVPMLSHDDPEVTGLAEQLWRLARPTLETSDESLSRLSFKQAVDQAGSDLFSQADIGIKALTMAKHLLSAAFGQVETACEVVTAEQPAGEAPPWEEAEPALVARIAATPPAVTEATPGQAKLCLSIGEVVLKLDLQVPSQSWLYQGYQRLRDTVERGIAKAQLASIEARRVGRLGMMTDDRELTVGLRHQRRPDGERVHRETTVSLRSRR